MEHKQLTPDELSEIENRLNGIILSIESCPECAGSGTFLGRDHNQHLCPHGMDGELIDASLSLFFDRRALQSENAALQSKLTESDAQCSYDDIRIKQLTELLSESEAKLMKAEDGLADMNSEYGRYLDGSIERKAYERAANHFDIYHPEAMLQPSEIMKEIRSLIPEDKFGLVEASLIFKGDKNSTPINKENVR